MLIPYDLSCTAFTPVGYVRLFDEQDYNSLVLAAVMNYISSTEAVCMFPRQTLIDRVSFIADNDKLMSDSDIWVKKYMSRGFKVVSHGHDLANLVLGSRFVGDVFCFKLEFTNGKL